MKILISRLEQYPAEQPIGFCVGFTVSATNGRSFYQDTVVSFDNASDDQSAVDFALAQMINGFKSQCDTLEAISQLLGAVVTEEKVTEAVTNAVEIPIEKPVEQVVNEIKQ